MTDHVATWKREACYVPAADGVLLAAYLFRPVDDRARCPVLWTHNRYNRGGVSQENWERWRARFPQLVPERSAQPELASVTAQPQELPDEMLGLVSHGYALVVVDARGSGASFGTHTGPFAPDESLDAKHVTRWLAAQPWCDGTVGMFGRSYMGANQHTAAATAPEPLRAIFPEMAPFDLYSTVHSGGIFRHDFARSWFAEVRRRDLDDPGVAVDADRDGSQLRAARAQHQGNRDLYEMFSALPYRDSVDEATGSQPYMANSPGFDGSDVRQPGVPTHHVAGWFDPFVRDAFLWFDNIDAVKRLIVGPWAHMGSAGLPLPDLYRNWFDLWLSGDGEDVAAQRIDYHTIGAPPGERWRSCETWPPPHCEPTAFLLGAGPSGTCASVNDGTLAHEQAVEEGGDDYVVDYEATSGAASRWTNAYGGPFGYPDMQANDARGLTYTSEPLAQPWEVTGHPLVHLWLSASADDVDVFAYLEEVSRDGSSTYVTEGALRASHRALHPAPYRHLGLPYHRSFAQDRQPLADDAVELVLDLFPTSWVFPQGHRIRLTVACADRDNALTPIVEPAPRVRLHRGPGAPSRLVLPLSKLDVRA